VTLDLLVVASHPADLRGMRNVLGDNLDGHVHQLHVAAKTVGVGCAAAAAGTAKRVFLLQPRAVVHLGTCGIYPALTGYQPFDVLLPTEIALVDHAVDSSRAAFPDPMSTRIQPASPMRSGIAASAPRTKAAPLATPLAETRDDELARFVPVRHGHHAENLEAFGVAQACQLARVPFATVCGVTHVVGPQGPADWRRFQRDASLAAAEAILAWIYGGAAGVPHGGA